MNDWRCLGNICHAVLNGMPVFRDVQHLNADFVAALTPQLAKRIGVPASIPSQTAAEE